MGVDPRSGQAGAPVFEQQDPKQLLSVLRPDLLLVDKPVQQLVGHSSQGGLWQIQEDSPCRPRRGELVSWTMVLLLPASLMCGGYRGAQQAHPWRRLSAAPGGSRK